MKVSDFHLLDFLSCLNSDLNGLSVKSCQTKKFLNFIYYLINCYLIAAHDVDIERSRESNEIEEVNETRGTFNEATFVVF